MGVLDASRECRVRTGVGLASEHLSVYRGTDDSNPSPSSEESANHRSVSPNHDVEKALHWRCSRETVMVTGGPSYGWRVG